MLSVLVLSACGKGQTPADPLRAAATDTCKATIEARAVNRKTLDYRTINVTPADKGQLNVAIDFSAKNEIGMASAMLANCTVSADGKMLVAINVKETR
ncbi:hypothetical protein [Massilia sp. TWP1-3-3]